MRSVFILLILLLTAGAACGQTNCAGEAIFTEKVCAGDEQTPQEAELFKLINDYRAENGLPAVVWSDALAKLANRRMLDLTQNIKSLSHSWSNCPYSVEDKSTWPCLTNSPRRLNTGYDGNGYENVFRRLGAPATPVEALAAWKKSPLHNGLILNLDNWKDIRFEGLGVAISGQYAAIWFGTPASKLAPLDAIGKGLGVAYSRLVNGLTSRLTFRRESSVGESQKWTGKSADDEILLELFGAEKDIAETNMALVVKVGKGIRLTAAARLSVQQFLKNLAPDWSARDKWFEDSIRVLAADPKALPTTDRGGRSLALKLDDAGNLRLLVIPSKKQRAEEL